MLLTDFGFYSVLTHELYSQKVVSCDSLFCSVFLYGAVGAIINWKTDPAVLDSTVRGAHSSALLVATRLDICRN